MSYFQIICQQINCASPFSNMRNSYPSFSTEAQNIKKEKKMIFCLIVYTVYTVFLEGRLEFVKRYKKGIFSFTYFFNHKLRNKQNIKSIEA